jgi:deoxyhypusine synthase
MSDAVSRATSDPEMRPVTVVSSVDSTVALPIFTAYTLATRAPRQPKRLSDRRKDLVAALTNELRRVVGPTTS